MQNHTIQGPTVQTTLNSFFQSKHQLQKEPFVYEKFLCYSCSFSIQ